ncbi:hypothetical protein [Mesorhizobium sp. L-8-3]|uniref:hypothetical protein n=1 Tax=Mesorhizobium sp. L-8-3 TaxID=2744522 RepID=UPI0019282704|nr:hypothetical protein [Mesorhizobium sp. L-8-3]BCH22481.1 hypothetical protein MesoLjLb_22660 [Mesorhizobium sp. L-8-3]
MQTKRWWQSVAVWGGVLSIATALGLAGITFDPASGDFSGNIYTLWGSITAFSGGVMAIVGRLRAVTRIGK